MDTTERCVLHPWLKKLSEKLWFTNKQKNNISMTSHITVEKQENNKIPHILSLFKISILWDSK